jgi:hypothetical protein
MESGLPGEQNQHSYMQREKKEWILQNPTYILYIYKFLQKSWLLSVSVCDTHYSNWPEAMFLCLKSFFFPNTKTIQSSPLWQQLPSSTLAFSAHRHHLLIRRTTAECAKEKRSFWDNTSMSHKGIDVTSLSFGLLDPMKLQIWETKGISERTAWIWNEKHQTGQKVSIFPSLNGLK